MAIYWRCPECKSDQNIKNKECKRCGTPMPRQNKKYRVVVKHNRRSITKVIPNSLELAKEIEAKIKQELISGEYYDRRKRAKEEILYDEFMKTKYIPYAKDNKKSWIKDEQLYRLWISPVMGKKALKDITQFDIERLKKIMNEAGKAPKTINYAIDIVRLSFNMAIKWNYAKYNPIIGVKRPKKDNRRIRFLTPNESQILLEECRKRSLQTYEIAFLSLHTGMRAGEIFNLRWNDIDFNNNVINIKDPKNSINRVAYMTDNVKSMLQEKYKRTEPTQDELVFKDRQGKRINRISKSFVRAVDAVGLNNNITDRRDKVVFHTLRHTFASWLAMQGVPIYTISKLMGHKTTIMTERYSHCPPQC